MMDDARLFAWWQLRISDRCSNTASLCINKDRIAAIGIKTLQLDCINKERLISNEPCSYC